MVANSNDGSGRREQFEAFVREHPDDAFARYGLAMELMRNGDNELALEQFHQLHERHREYAAGFQQAGQLLIALGRSSEARAILECGLSAAQRAGNAHAASEIQGLLDDCQRL